MSYSVRLLGRARIHHEGQWRPLLTDKRGALLAFLAAAGDWVARDRLAFLFWPDTDNTTARRNLRQLIRRTRSLAYGDALEVEADQIRWPVATDLAAFKGALGDEDWPAAAEHYGGPLLDDYGGVAGEAFWAWLDVERGALHGRYREAALRAAEALSGGGKHQDAADLLRRAWERDAYDEGVLQAYLEQAASAGQRQGALATYHAFAERLQDELGVAPSETTAALAEAIEADRAAPPTPRAPPAAPLPRKLEPLVGRAHERREVGALLDGGRFVALTGLGGVGKTRLALALAAERMGDYRDGVFVATLAGLDDPGAVPFALADALSLSFSGAEEPQQQLEAYLRERELLLVIDNLEGVIEAAPGLVDLLEAAPGLSLLVTSRRLPDLPGLASYPLGGLPSNEGAPSDKGGAGDAQRLFIQEARRHQPTFEPDEADQAAIGRLCRQVAGLPLALVLAAAWVRELGCAAIAGEVERGLEALGREGRRHHDSVRAVFDQSWALLSPEQQRLLARLAVFRGGFRRDSARAVAGASPYGLLSLQSRSLLERSADDRLDLHPLVRQYAGERLTASGEAAATREDHARHYADFWQESWSMVLAGDESGWLEHVAREGDNTRAMWAWAVEARDERVIGATARALTGFFGLRSRYREGVELLGAAAEVFPEPTPLRAKLVARLGRMHLSQRRVDLARALLEEALAIHERVPSEPFERTFALMNLAAVARSEGDLTGAASLFGRSLELFEEQGNRKAVGQTLYNLATTAIDLGDRAGARAHLERSLAIAEELGDTYAGAYGRTRLADLDVAQGDLERAEALYSEADALFDELAHTAGGAAVAQGRAGLARAAGDQDAARRFLTESLDTYRTLGRTLEVAALHAELGTLEAGLERLAEAREHVAAALAAARTTAAPATLLTVLAHALTADVPALAAERRLKWLLTVAEHPACPPELEARLARCIDSARRALPADAVRTAEAAAATATAEAAADALADALADAPSRPRSPDRA